MSDSRPPIRRLLSYATGHRRDIWVASVYSVLNKVMDIAPEILIGGAVDVVVRREESWLGALGVEGLANQMWVLALLTLVVWGLESLFEYLYSVRWRNLAQTVQHELRIDAYAHTQDLDMAYFEDRSTGGLMAILNDDVNQLERFLDVGANDLIQTLTSVVGVSVVFFALSPVVAGLALIPIPFVIAGSLAFTRRLAPRYLAVRNQAGDVSGQLANNLGGLATIKAFVAERRETARITASSERYRTVNAEAIRLSSAFIPVVRIAILAGFLVTLLYGGFRVLDGTLEVAAYSVLVFLTQRLLWPLTRLGETLDLYQRSMASTERILDLLDTPSSIHDGDQQLPPVAGHVAFRNVSFAYGSGPQVLHDVSIDVPRGTTCALVGSTGSGKTTLVRLLLRFADVDSGSVTVDGHDVRDVRLDELRSAMGLVSQDVFLFSGTVAENIAYGRPGASLEDITQAARAAEAHDFICELADGYETIVGERGQKLSGGQRQRISLARAFLVDPAILILDEATSAVDNETEAAIQRSLRRISHQRTTIVIAHRLSTIRHADAIHVLESGRVIETGTHEELVEAGGVYAGLWAVQTGEVESAKISSQHDGGT